MEWDEVEWVEFGAGEAMFHRSLGPTETHVLEPNMHLCSCGLPRGTLPIAGSNAFPWTLNFCWCPRCPLSWALGTQANHKSILTNSN